MRIIIVDVFLCGVCLIMSEVTVTTNTTPPLKVVCFRASFITLNCYDGSHLWWPNKIRSVCCGFAATVDSGGQSEWFSYPEYCATAATALVPDALTGICQLSHGSSAKVFSFRTEHPTNS